MDADPTTSPEELTRTARRSAFRRSTWPRREAGSRLVGACDPLISPGFRLSRLDTVFAIGSCFARNIEEYLDRAGVPVLTRSLRFPPTELRANARGNDLLVKYTPGSILAEVEAALRPSAVSTSPDIFVQADDLDGHCDTFLPLDARPVPMSRCTERRQDITRLYEGLRGCGALFLTLGLIEHWFDRRTGLYINGVPTPALRSRHPDRFEFRLLDFDGNRRLVDETIRLLRAENPNLRIVLTTSPVPLGQTFTDQDVITANSYSKSVLRTICQEMAAVHDRVDYFPSYEMVVMSPPEAAWEDDLRHVRDAMVGSIMRRFLASYVPDLAADELDVAEQLSRARSLLDTRHFAQAVAAFAELEPRLGADPGFLASQALAAILAENSPEADRVTALLLERNPGDWADILRARAAILGGRHGEALTHLRSAGRDERTSFHAGGWEMEVGRLLADRAVELSGALRAANAIANEWASPGKKPWITRRTLAILKREKRSDELARMRAIIDER